MQQLYRNLFEHSQDAIMLLNEGGFLDCNPATLRIFGIASKDAFVGTHPADLSPSVQADGADSQTAAQARIAEAMRTGKANFAWLHKRADGTVFPAEVLLSRVTDGDEVIIVGVVRDISERVSACDRLRASEEKFRGVVDNIEIGISVISPDMKIVSMNPKMREWFPGIDPDEAPLCYASFNNPPCSEVCSYCPTVKTLGDGRVHESVTETPSGSEIRNFRIVSSPLKDAAGRTVAAIEMVEDITDRARAQEEFLRIQKLESLGMMAGGIAHDFNNMLTAVIGNISCLRDSSELSPEQQAIVEDLFTATRTAQGLTRQLLTFATGGAPVKSVVALGPLLLETVRFANRGSDSRCVFDISPDLSPVRADAGQLAQVIQNLTINAHQAMSGGGEIRVKAWNRPAGDGRPESVCASISDTGPGIPANIVGKIFDPYFSTKQKGRGLGLAACASIVQRHGGTLQVRSHSGEGAVFELALRATDEALPPPASAPAMTGAGRVLVLEDDDMVAKVIARILKKLGYEFERVRDGGEAVEAYLGARGGANPFDAAIVDLTIPGGMGGKEAAERIKAAAPEAKLIVSSGYCDDSTLAELEKSGFEAALGKPYDAAQVSEVLRRVLSAGPEG